MALDTAQERVALLKSGVFGKAIEKLYIQQNNFEIVEVIWAEFIRDYDGNK